MSDIEKRYEIVPQMREYDRMQMDWVPYLMSFQASGYSSDVVNTDSRGFRINYKGEDAVANFQNPHDLPVSLLMGGSTAFGIGTTGDRKTIPSLLNASTDDLWFNFGGRAFSSTQEFFLFLFYHVWLKKIRRIVIFSGINNLSLIYLSRGYIKEIGPFFHWNRFQKMMRETPLSPKRKILKTLFHPVCGDQIDYASISLGQLFTNIFRKGQSSPREAHPSEVNKISDDPGQKKEDLLHVMDRDIRNWRLMCGALGIELFYVLQPLANWIQRKPSGEEEILFGILDRREDNVWNVLRDHMGDEQYRWFSGHLGRICRSYEVPFYDLNEMLTRRKLDGAWLFVDRIHLTDEGNRITSNIIQEEIIS